MALCKSTQSRATSSGSASLLVVLLVITVAACRASPPPASRPSAEGLAGDVVAASQDTATLREAVAAVNAAVRALPDCEQAGPALTVARQKLDDAAPRLATTAGQTSLASLRAQLDRASQACP